MSSSPNNVPAWIFWLLTVIGVPATLYLLTQHPWQAIGLGLLCGFIYIARDVWQKELQNDFVKAVADYIRSIFRSILHFLNGWQHLKPYYRYLHKAYGFVGVQWIDPEGLTRQHLLGLEQIFIEPTLDSSEDPLNTIQYYLASKREPLVLLGEVGMGKSTLLRYIALTTVDRRQRLKWKISYKLPFYLSLGLDAFTDELVKNRELLLKKALEVAMNEKGWKARPGWIERKLEKGDCLVLLDGLDEVGDANIRQQVVTWIQRKLTSDDNKNRFIITSRPASYKENPLENVPVLYIQSFNQEQIYTFIDKWYKVTSGKLLRAEALKKHLFLNPELFKLVRNPLLLTMAITVHQHRGRLPQSRVALYQEIFEVYLTEHPTHPRKRWRWSIEVPYDNSMLPAREKRQEILQILAYKMMERRMRRIVPTDAEDLIKDHFKNSPITPKEFLQNVQHNGILAFSEPYQFTHLSFQEYLAAMYIKNLPKPELVVNHRNLIDLGWWRETIVFYGAQADPTPVMKACLKGESLSEDAFDLALILMEPEIRKNVEELKKSKPEVDEACKRLEQAASLAAEAKDTWHEMAHKRLKQRQWKLIPNDETSEEMSTKDSSLITCVEYQLFLYQPEYRICQPDHWQGDRFPTGQGLAPVLGVRPLDADAFCNWLSAQDESRTRCYRLPTFKETKEISIEDAGTGYWTKDGSTYQFVWGEEGPLPSNILSQDRLLDLWAQDNTKHLLNEERLLVNYISFADKLKDARRCHHDLVEHLSSIRKCISDKVSDLQVKHHRTLDCKKNLKIQIDAAREKKAKSEQTLEDIKSRRTQLPKVRKEKVKLKGSLDSIRRNKEKTHKDLINLKTSKPRKQSRDQIAVNQKIAELDKQKEHIEGEKQQLEKKLKSVCAQESQLIKLLRGADEKEKSAKKQSEDALKRENDLRKKLESVEKEEKNAKHQLDFFSSLANQFYKIYEDFSLFRSTDNDALSIALANTQWLNLDRIIVVANEKALDNVCVTINSNIKELTNRLDLFQSESDITFANTKSDIDNALTSARNLVHQFDQITVGKYIQKFDSILSFYCVQLATNKKRSYIRKNWRSRLHIRYFAKVLAEHLSYWSQKELFSFALASQSMSQFYFDVYVAFAILEERINGNLSSSEGILIVRESTQEKTTKQLS